ncbi:MAG: carbon-nitrogen hydrolase family protein [Desulfovibrionaceae bacterium]|jgi:predicted amidohydrolase|nr:carbon-nitrogen hydrolase family protein [Desulfovibrionaceae bacterium]
MSSFFRKMLIVFAIALFMVSSVVAADATETAKAAAPKDEMKVALVNFQAVWGDKAKNLGMMLADIKEAAARGANMILFPEMCLTGYAMEKGDGIKRADRMQVKLAEPFDGPSAQAVAKLAKEKGVYVVYGYPERIGGDPLNVYNSALAVGPEGIIGSYQKVHPFGSEVIWCKTGTKPFTFDTPWGPVGISICYDTYNYPELGRYYAARGCRLILNPTATSRAYSAASALVDGKPVNDGKPINGSNARWVNRFKSRVEAVVIQSDVFVASANLVGAETAADGTFMGTCFPGGSSMVGPMDDKEGTPSYIGYYGTDPALATDAGVIYSTVDLTKATRKSVENYIKTDLQEEYLYMPKLYAEWFDELAKGKYGHKKAD